MNRFVLAAPLLLILAGCPVATPEDDPYDSCNAGDECSGGLACLETTLPATSGFSGNLCTSSCSVDTDCVQVPTNFAANCVNGQCYLTCPSSDSCPFSQSCLTFTDQNGNPVSLCTP